MDNFNSLEAATKAVIEYAKGHDQITVSDVFSTDRTLNPEHVSLVCQFKSDTGEFKIVNDNPRTYEKTEKFIN